MLAKLTAKFRKLKHHAWKDGDKWCEFMRKLSGPVLRDTARLSQRYPPIARYGVFGVSTWPIGCDTPSPFSERFPLGEHAKWGCDTPPHKRGISAILARYLMKKGKMGAIPPSAILSRKGIARYGAVSRTGPLSAQIKNFSESHLLFLCSCGSACCCSASTSNLVTCTEVSCLKQPLLAKTESHAWQQYWCSAKQLHNYWQIMTSEAARTKPNAGDWKGIPTSKSLSDWRPLTHTRNMDRLPLALRCIKATRSISACPGPTKHRENGDNNAPTRPAN